MQIIPAIDIKNGKCVRLRQGAMDDVTIFNDNPLDAAERWVSQGAERIHIVDLDGAVAGEAVNAPIIKEICQTYRYTEIQVGGGIRNHNTVRDYLNVGVSYVIIGTKAVEEPDFLRQLVESYPKKIILGIDTKDGYVSTDGWKTVSDCDAIEFITQFRGLNLAGVIYTDIARDGMMQGFNYEATGSLSQCIDVPIIASGGVTNLDDIKQLLSLEKYGISGAIVGRALYEGTLDFKEATQMCANSTQQNAIEC